MIRRLHLLALVAATATAASTIAATGSGPSLSLRDSFRIGTEGVLCTAQLRPLDANLKGMFDRGYAIVCRDAAASVGNLYALRAEGRDPLADLAARRPADISCGPSAPITVEGLGTVGRAECVSSSKVRYHSYSVRRGNTLYVAEGLGGYDPALSLGLRTLVADRPVAGDVQVATTSAGDPAAFARIQAGTLDADSALAEAYQRNNAGSFAESAEFFQTLVERGAGQAQGSRPAEYLVNQALQQSNLGDFRAAESLFRQAEGRGATGDPVVGRLLRNYRAIDLLNQRRASAALKVLARPVVPAPGDEGDSELARGVISPTLADQINRTNAGLERLGGVDRRLRTSERTQILDGQAEQLRGVAQRIQGNYPAAMASLEGANRTLASVRGGRVVSTAFMRSESFAEMALISEAQGDATGAERSLVRSEQILAADYPQSAASLAARARLAAFLGRQGQVDRALQLYSEVVAEGERLPGAAAAMRTLIGPYFELLVARVDKDPAAAAAMFAASQVMVRPGVAQTQAVLARELSSGDDAAAALFRQSVNQSRDIARATGEVARLAAAGPQPDSPEAITLAAARTRLEALERDQTALQSRLGDYPRYRVLAPQGLALADLQKALRPGEAYYQLRLVGQTGYAMLITRERAQAIKIAATAEELDESVRKIRESIVMIENGQAVTYPFDLQRARNLYKLLFDGFGAPLTGVTHLIYEPDGALLQLPANLLVTDQAGVDGYVARQTRPNADEFDLTAIAWLGKDRDVSTAVSPRSFVDVRSVAPSKAKMTYLGLGQNAVPIAKPSFLRTAAATPGAAADDCSWPVQAWQNPIKATELFLASQAVGQSRSQVVTDAAFSDTSIRERTDLADFRVIHFATHGLVSAPRPECPARPALLTSFGSSGSDGLLTFREIYDLRLDADVVVLSACDTAGMATVAATREAGVTTGGNFALDGLVRAFVGAGARSVIASHWPVPDDYDATKRLILGLFNAPPGTAMASALRRAQQALMADPQTSHPYYWSAFAIVGDGEQPVLRGR